MTRSEEIRQAGIELYRNRPMCIGGGAFSEMIDKMNRNYAFEEGAKWADEHPQFDKETFIEKACWWLRETAHFYVSDFTGGLDDNGLIEDFKKAMEE